ncbi:unnamed protein product [Effrenium voratum]|uniref:Uncharacterized protein n=1 Tax=Effrenium voratum TaxID=2562239 RepID=A0AA36N9W3_9DINO|nr:unnamed protein product [Effrenium voratum]
MAKEVAQGRELLQHYRRRRKLGLLPGRRTSAATVAAERADALLSHSAFGYFPPDRPRAQLQLELASRRKALEAQVAELEAAEEAQRALAAEAEQRQHALQREMAAAVEEHSQLSRQLPELRARRQELGREAWRLKALLQDLAEQRVSQQAPPRQPAPGAAERLQMHRDYLLQLQAEHQQLKLSADRALLMRGTSS